jgi:hypothetical protein
MHDEGIINAIKEELKTDIKFSECQPENWNK